MKIKFSEIPDKLKYPPSCRAQLSTLHANVVSAAIKVYSGIYRQRQHIVAVMNSISLIVISNDVIPEIMKSAEVLNCEISDDSICRAILKDLYINEKDIIWDIAIVDSYEAKTEEPVSPIQPAVPITSFDTPPTPKEDLYLRPPIVPQFNIKDPWKAQLIDNTPYVIYRSYPEIPKRQNEISCTTDVSKMTADDLYKLFPNRFIQTRAATLYEYQPTLDNDDELGSILPIEGYTKNQLIDNLIKYPHIFKLYRVIDDELVSFYSHIEVDGQLYRTADIWNALPESKTIPFTSEYIKEYVVRRYLLERDVKHIEHQYPLYGSLDPFLTLFMPISSYIRYGYSDILEIARQCVRARVSYKQTRNPVLRRIENA